jgi:hypothetical protein
MRNNLHILSILILMISFISACKKDTDDRRTFYKPIDPVSQPNEFSRALIINGLNADGSSPKASNPSAIVIQSYQSSASVSNDNVLFIPFVFETSNSVAGVFIQVENADNYWMVPIDQVNGNSYVANVGIPPHVYPGNVAIYYQIYDDQGNISERNVLPTSIVSAEDVCDGGTHGVSGSDGLNARSYQLGNKPGTVRIEYETYSVPDRVDIRYNNEWVFSMGNLLSNTNPSPPIKQCSAVTSGDGFRGESGVYEFDFDPSISRKLDVYVSGCLDGGTAWNYSVSCGGGSGSNTAWHDNLPDCPCTYEEAQRLATDGVGEGEWLDCGEASIYHYGAATEVRWAPDGSDNPQGQQCTYNDRGDLITGGIAAGSPDLVSPRSCGFTGPYASSFSALAALEHNVADVMPWKQGYQVSLPCEMYLDQWPANQGSCGGNIQIGRIDHLTPYSGNMTCEEFVWLFQAVTEHLDEDDRLRRFILFEGGSLGANQLKDDLQDLAGELKCDNNSDEYCKAINKILENL